MVCKQSRCAPFSREHGVLDWNDNQSPEDSQQHCLKRIVPRQSVVRPAALHNACYGCVRGLRPTGRLCLGRFTDIMARTARNQARREDLNCVCGTVLLGLRPYVSVVCTAGGAHPSNLVHTERQLQGYSNGETAMGRVRFGAYGLESPAHIKTTGCG